MGGAIAPLAPPVPPPMALTTDLDFLLRNLKSRGPSSVQAKGVRAIIVMIHFVNKALHQSKKKKKKKI